MTLPIISILIVAAIVFRWLQWRRSSYVIFFVALAAFLAIGCGPLPALLANGLQAGYVVDVTVEPGSGAMAIVLLGNGTERLAGSQGNAIEPAPLAYGRLFKALELYQTCKRRSANSACILLVTGGDPQHHGASEAAVYGARLQGLGVDPRDLILEERSLNTFQNAQYSAPLLSAHSAERVLLVTSGLHLRRSLLYFAHFGVKAHPVRADYVSAMPSALPLSYNFLVADLAVHEYEGVLRYYVYQFLGWNVHAKKAGAA